MAAEYVNRITVKRNGVYISSRSANDSLPFKSWRSDILSQSYKTKGQEGLDKEIIRMLFECPIVLAGDHKSLSRYRYALKCSRLNHAYGKYIDKLIACFNSLDKSDQESVLRDLRNPTVKAKQYLKQKKKLADELYSFVAEFCKEYKH